MLCAYPLDIFLSSTILCLISLPLQANVKTLSNLGEKSTSKAKNTLSSFTKDYLIFKMERRCCEKYSFLTLKNIEEFNTSTEKMQLSLLLKVLLN